MPFQDIDKVQVLSLAGSSSCKRNAVQNRFPPDCLQHWIVVCIHGSDLCHRGKRLSPHSISNQLCPIFSCMPMAIYIEPSKTQVNGIQFFKSHEALSANHNYKWIGQSPLKSCFMHPGPISKIFCQKRKLI